MTSLLLDPLHDACGDTVKDTDLCARVFRATHNTFLASSSEWLIAKPLRLIVVIAFALVMRWLAARAIRRIVRGIASDKLGEVVGPLSAERRQQRAKTVGSVATSAVGTLLVGIVIVTALGEVGVALGPILASAGVLGVALGFGAQNLVKDYLSGFFFLIEDAYGVGDVVDLGPASGVVESVGMRTTHVRDGKGVLWHVRNGEIVRVGNTSQGDSQGTIDLILKHGGNLHTGIDAMREACEDLWASRGPQLGLLAVPEVIGVQDVNEIGTTIRTNFKRRPDSDEADRALRLCLMDALANVSVDLADIADRR